MRKADVSEIESISRAVDRLRVHVERHPSPELWNIYHGIFGAVAAHAILAIGEQRKAQRAKAQKPRARAADGTRISDQQLRDFREEFVRKYGSERGLIKAASANFGIDRGTAGSRYKKLEE